MRRALKTLGAFGFPATALAAAYGAEGFLDARLARTERLLEGTYTPQNNGDVWLDGCA